MKKVFLLAGVVVVGLGTLWAQDKKQTTPTQPATQTVRATHSLQEKDPQIIAERKTARLEKEIGLTTEQKEKAYNVFLKDAEAGRERASLRQETNEQIKAILTPEQTAQFEARQKSRKEVMIRKREESGRQNLKMAPANQSGVISK